MYNPIITILCSLLLIVMLIFEIMLRKRNKESVIGQPTIDTGLFYLAKAALILPIFFVFIESLNLNISLIQTAEALRSLATLIFAIGSILAILSFYYMGSDLRVGLPKQKTKLRTEGLFAISRNPIYVSFYIMILGSALYVLNPINWVIGIIAILLHHKIILSEEKFLENRFGNQWREYNSKVRRYI